MWCGGRRQRTPVPVEQGSCTRADDPLLVIARPNLRFAAIAALEAENWVRQSLPRGSAFDILDERVGSAEQPRP